MAHTLLPDYDRNARFLPRIVTRRAGGVAAPLQHWTDGQGWKRKADTLLPRYYQDARFVPTIFIMCREAGLLQSY